MPNKIYQTILFCAGLALYSQIQYIKYKEEKVRLSQLEQTISKNEAFNSAYELIQNSNSILDPIVLLGKVYAAEEYIKERK